MIEKRTNVDFLRIETSLCSLSETKCFMNRLQVHPEDYQDEYFDIRDQHDGNIKKTRFDCVIQL